jgi:hypothetical protein
LPNPGWNLGRRGSVHISILRFMQP